MSTTAIREPKKRRGQKPLPKPSQTVAVVVYDEQIVALDSIADKRGLSRSAAMRDALALFLAVNRDFVSSDDNHSMPEREEATA